MMHRSKLMAKALLVLAASAAVTVDHDNSLSKPSNTHALKLQLSAAKKDKQNQNPLDAVKGFFGLFGGKGNKNVQKKQTDTHIEDMKEIFGTVEDKMGSSAASASPTPSPSTYRSPFEMTFVPDVVYVGYAPSVEAQKTGAERNALLDEQKLRSIVASGLPTGTPPGTPPFSPPASPTPSEAGNVAAYVPEAKPSPMDMRSSLRGTAVVHQAERLDRERETRRTREGERESAKASPACAQAAAPKRTYSWYRRQSQEKMKQNKLQAQQAAQAHNRNICPTFTPAAGATPSLRRGATPADRSGSSAQEQSKKPVSNAAVQGSQSQKQNTYSPTGLTSMAPKKDRPEVFTSAFYCDPTGRVIGSSTTITQGSRKFEVNMYNGHTWTNKPRR